MKTTRLIKGIVAISSAVLISLNIPMAILSIHAGKVLLAFGYSNVALLIALWAWAHWRAENSCKEADKQLALARELNDEIGALVKRPCRCGEPGE